MKKLLVATTSLFLAASVYANTEGDHRAKFQEMDANSSGSISMEEARNAGIDEAAFNRHDTDGDGQLSEQEFQAKKRAKKDGSHGSSNHGKTATDEPYGDGQNRR